MNDVLDYIYPSWYEKTKAEINKQQFHIMINLI